MKETDLAQIVNAKDAAARLHAISVRLCFQRVTDDIITDMREAIQDIVAGLEMATLWVSEQEKPREE